MHILDELKFDSNGLITAIIQDFENRCTYDGLHEP